MKNQLQTITWITILTFLLTACVPSNNSTAVPLVSPTPTTQVGTYAAPILGIEDQMLNTSDKILKNEFDTMLQKSAELNSFSGSVLVIQNGSVILSSGYGFSDREKNIPNTSQTRFPICSLTKQFTAMAILMLQEQGKLNVQDGICRYLTDCPEPWEPITIHQLLTHTSGIPDLVEEFWTRDVTSPVPLEQLIAEAKSRSVVSQPGEDFSYNNTGYILLGRIIESTSGQTYATFLKENIFQPLKMWNTSFDPNPQIWQLGTKTKPKLLHPLSICGWVFPQVRCTRL